MVRPITGGGILRCVQRQVNETAGLGLISKGTNGSRTASLVGPGRDRTDDLFHAISHLRLWRSDTDKARVIVRGSVHAGLPAVPCPSPVPERYHPTPSDTGRDGRVTTQVTTQIPRQPGASLSCPKMRGVGRRRRLSTRLRTSRNFLLFFQYRDLLRIASPAPRGKIPTTLG